MDEAILSIFLISVLVSISGNLAVFRKAFFLIAGVAHSALAGVALSLLLSSFGIHADYFLIATTFAIAFAILASAVSKFSDIDTGIAISFALSMALAVIFISLVRNVSAKLWSFLFGELLLVTPQDIFYLAISAIFVIIILGCVYEKILIFLFDPEGAKASGLNTKLLDMAIVLIISISVVAVLRSVGAVLTYSIFVAPSAVAKEVAKSVEQSLVISFLIAFMSLFFGIIISILFPVSASAISAFLVSMIYLGFVALKRR
ncbi:MAG: iron chelate uptake ABC transporter family permease subunit [Archaeoglobaceae archaeon]